MSTIALPLDTFPVPRTRRGGAVPRRRLAVALAPPPVPAGPPVLVPAPAPVPGTSPAPAVPGDGVVPRCVTPRPASAEAPLRLTSRGRLVAAAAVLLLVTATALGASRGAQLAATVPASSVAVPAAGTSAGAVVVEAGDTLWAIAAGLAAPGEDVRDVVTQLQTLNGLTSSDLAVGQRLLLP
ncbi:LysM peptidoglycan-binding domain-containing protein [Pseudokineococcus sp. 1T1Z-3]|uniref:LysM peptidoglycan-binding domain-containing protein n=1 Tax=Pseudokineococcus sp. 1T1Z-3 TaxID=3132745 RepID=UPI00309CC110